jgi:hypothetical protein
VEVALNSKGTIALNLPAYTCLVERILIAMTSLNALIQIQRSDSAESLTKGGVFASLLGAQVLTTALPNEYAGPAPFRVEPNCTLTFEITDKSGAANKTYIGVFTQKVAPRT